ncbi:hypothetical protein PHYBOEH_006790 [Phytophthora boehmeriae]|uniref:Bzip transcription factor n=1 Tax=Phytophthora boehmeriae TaxID=109152 RepID=A0A8T1WCQ2_9STRA|nr:hypothetical protein PHYBOEH_006790 [Phytophthora boehmeriae]
MKSSLVAEWKKAKRKEQCRRAQLKYLRRKREELQKLIGGIKRLKREIKKLEARKAEIRKQQKRRVQFVTSLYSSLQTDIKQQQLPDVRNYERTYGCSPALQVLSDLQREEFDSMESLRLHWGWYRSQFRQFELSVASYECLVAGKHLIVKATGSLRLGIECEDNSDVIECPVFQQFEFEIGEHDVRRITSEVNLVSFVHGKEPLSPGRILDALSYLSQRFALQTNVR